MNKWSLSWAYIRSQPLNTILNVTLLSLALAIMTFLIVLNHQISRAFEKDLANIDVVVGAKGSPMQLILSGVFHIDIPPGNVSLSEVENLKKHPMVRDVIPLSLGDSYASFRIVGSVASYLEMYETQFAQGRLWDDSMQVVLGAKVAEKLKLKIGDSFVGEHGLSEGGHGHEQAIYQVVGILKAQQSSIDQLIITSLDSVWKVHETELALDKQDQEYLKKEREVSMALVTYKTPMAALSFPRYVNSKTTMQAAAPAIEVTRLLTLLGVGTDALQVFAGILLLTSGLSVFIGLWSSLKARKADLALLRMLGASPVQIAGLIWFEAFALAIAATIVGLFLGQSLILITAHLLGLDGGILLTAFSWPLEIGWVPLIALLIASVAACLPAWSVFKMNVLQVLQQRS